MGDKGQKDKDKNKKKMDKKRDDKAEKSKQKNHPAAQAPLGGQGPKGARR